jgi:hypothetical protein
MDIDRDAAADRITAYFDRVMADPMAAKQEIFDEIGREMGSAWLQANRRFVEADWEYAALLFGFAAE